MSFKQNTKKTLLSLSLFCLPATLLAADADADKNNVQQQLDQLKTQISELQQHINSQAAAKEKPEDGITIGGAVRFQYTNNSYDKANVQQKGGIAFDTFRLNLDGKKGDVILSAEWRWYEYMTTLHHAWVGYDFDDNNQIQIGLTRLPFGNQAYNSHSFFFSSNYYLGLEDTYALGSLFVHDSNHINVQLGFFKNGARGVGGNNENYSYDLTKDSNDNTVGVSNTGALRVVGKLNPNDDFSLEAGVSGLYGGIYNSSLNSVRTGNYGAYAAHTDINYKRFNAKLQATHYDYRFSDNDSTMKLGGYAGDYETPTHAHTYTLGLSYHQPVSIGPITGLDFYNDYSAVTNKSDDSNGDHIASTYMNVTGVGISAGGVYAYADYINARNQPFIGGDFVGSSGNDVEHRFNLNIGYYF